MHTHNDRVQYWAASLLAIYGVATIVSSLKYNPIVRGKSMISF